MILRKQRKICIWKFEMPNGQRAPRCWVVRCPEHGIVRSSYSDKSTHSMWNIAYNYALIHYFDYHREEGLK